MHFKAMILSRVGRYREATQAITAGEKNAKSGDNQPYEGGLRLVAALLALERKDQAGALREIDTVEGIFAGQPSDLERRARIYRRLLTYGSHSSWVAPMEPLYVLQVARLLEKNRDRTAALDEYERLLSLWKSADADLPDLAEARQAVKRLRSDVSGVSGSR